MNIMNNMRKFFILIEFISYPYDPYCHKQISANFFEQ